MFSPRPGRFRPLKVTTRVVKRRSARSSRVPNTLAHQHSEAPHPSQVPHVVWGATCTVTSARVVKVEMRQQAHRASRPRHVRVKGNGSVGFRGWGVEESKCTRPKSFQKFAPAGGSGKRLLWCPVMTHPCGGARAGGRVPGSWRFRWGQEAFSLKPAVHLSADVADSADGGAGPPNPCWVWASLHRCAGVSLHVPVSLRHRRHRRFQQLFQGQGWGCSVPGPDALRGEILRQASRSPSRQRPRPPPRVTRTTASQRGRR